MGLRFFVWIFAGLFATYAPKWMDHAEKMNRRMLDFMTATDDAHSGHGSSHT